MVARVFADEELERLREFPEVNRDDLVRFFTLTSTDLAFVDPGRGRGPADRLGLSLTLCTLPWLGFVPDDVRAAPPVAVTRLAAQLQGRARLAEMVPVSRFEMLMCADWLRRELGVFGRCSRRLVRHLCWPYWRAGWCNRNIVHAMDHRPSAFNQSRGCCSPPEHVCSPMQFIRVTAQCLAGTGRSNPSRLLVRTPGQRDCRPTCRCAAAARR